MASGSMANFNDMFPNRLQSELGIKCCDPEHFTDRDPGFTGNFFKSFFRDVTIQLLYTLQKRDQAALFPFVPVDQAVELDQIRAVDGRECLS